MLKILKKKLIVAFVASAATVAIVLGVSTKTLSMIHEANTTIKNSQTSNIKENNINDELKESKDFQNGDQNNDDKDLNSLADTENSNDNSQQNNENTNKQVAIAVTSKLEKSSNNNDANKQVATSSHSEKSNNNDDTNKQTATSSQLKEANSNVNTEKQTSTKPTEEVKKTTIYYDRTTSIYANDNITLLRVEYYANNKLTYYSVIEKFDAATKSYTEKIYKCNRETNIDPLVRTDVYANGSLIKSY